MLLGDLKKAEAISLSGDDVISIAKPTKVKVMTYEELAPIQTLHDLFSGNTEAIALLYQTSRNSGHWVALMFDKQSRKFTFYDSYGIKMDDELKLEDYNHQAHLTRIVQNSKNLFHGFDQNNKRMQARVEDVNTCGRYTALRCKYKNLSNHEFNEMIRPIMLNHPDEVVTMLTFTHSQ